VNTRTEFADNGRALRLLAAGLVVLNGFFPALWILLTSLKTEAELVSKPSPGGRWHPRSATTCRPSPNSRC
jgi:ABC-type glycerol-3-phosphate transport system permease component